MRAAPRVLVLLLAAALFALGTDPGIEGASKRNTGGSDSASKASRSSKKAKGGKGKTPKRKSSRKSKKAKKAKSAKRLSAAELAASLPAAAIEFPEALEPFFRSLRALGQPPAEGVEEPRIARVLHFGDSHVAADFWTGELRALFQARFGDAGPGTVMPGKPWKYFRHSRAQSLGGRGWIRCGLRDDPCPGPAGLSRVGLRPGPHPARMERAILEAEFRTAEILCAASEDWDRTVTIDGRRLAKADPLAPEAGIEASPVVGDSRDGEEEANIPPTIPQEEFSTDLGESDYFLFAAWNREPLSPGPHRIEVDLGGGALLLGVDLRSGQSGILYDALGINGSEITDLDAWGPGERADLLRHASPALIVVSFGTNDMGAKGFDPESYRATCLGVLGGLKADAPNAAILVTGPMDRGGRSRRTRARMLERSGTCTEALRGAARDAGCAFWDARAAMGGEGSIARWVSAGLARRDQVHLAESGYRTLARALFQALMDPFEKGPPLTEVPLIPVEPSSP